MNEGAKIQLSAREMELVTNTEWIFTKQLILEKVYHLLGQLHHRFKTIVHKEKNFLPAAWQKPGGKIAKGENYKGLPYAILDYPAVFSKEEIFAVRTMFWWGNFFSISLHLSGEACKMITNLNEGIQFLEQNDFSVSLNENEWEHHFQPTNFVKIEELNENEIIQLAEKKFLKIAKKTGLEEWNLAHAFLEKSFGEIIQFIKISCPACGKDL
jgi:hypothetical protein